MKIVYSFLTVFLLSVVVAPVFADGTHGVKVTVKNFSGDEIQIQTYNGKDGAMVVPHKVYYLDNLGTKIVKAHGKGSGKLKMNVVRTHVGNRCKSKDGTVLLASLGSIWKDGDTVEVWSCN